MWMILVALAAYGVFRISREIIGDQGHLTDEDIREYKYKRRSLSENFQRRITNHIGVCDQCRDRFTDVMNE